MRKSSFVENVIKHISDKRAKADIEFELTDHFIEKEQWYEELGYDEDSAFEHADTAMGNPDVIGEQLSSFEKGSSAKSVIAFLIAFLPSLAFLFDTTMTGFEFTDLRCYFSFLFNLILIIYASKRQNIFLLLWGTVSSLFVVWNDLLITSTIEYKLKGDSIAKVFFFGIVDFGDSIVLPENDSAIDRIYDALASRYSGLSLFLFILSVSLIIIFCLATLLRIILIRLRENTLTGYYICKVLKSIFVTYTVFIGIIVGLQIYDFISFEIHYTDYSAETVSKMDEIIINGITDYEKTGDKEYLSCWEEAEKLSDDYCKITDRTMEVQPYHIMTSIYTVRNSVSKETGEQVIEFAQSGNGLIKDAPKPYTIDFDEANKTVLLNYDCEVYGLMKLKFIYSDGEFRLCGSSITGEVNIRLSDEQLKLFYNEFLRIKSSQSNDIDYNLDEYIPNSYKYILMNFYGISYNISKDKYVAYLNVEPFYIAEYEGKNYSYEKKNYIITEFSFADSGVELEIIYDESFVRQEDFGREEMYTDAYLNLVKDRYFARCLYGEYIKDKSNFPENLSEIDKKIDGSIEYDYYGYDYDNYDYAVYYRFWLPGDEELSEGVYSPDFKSSKRYMPQRNY